MVSFYKCPLECSVENVELIGLDEVNFILFTGYTITSGLHHTILIKYDDNEYNNNIPQKYIKHV